ncbi:MAG: shikimate dehydrogenase [Marinicellaceae bacterium]
MKNKTHKLALFGNPVKHSLSPLIHSQFAEQFELAIDYQLIQVDENKLQDAVLDFFDAGGLGANVTLPHKSLALSVVDRVTKISKLSQAVNTIYHNNKSLLCGDNTDGKGFVKDIKKRLGFKIKNKSILILGAGGATQGIVPAIMKQQPKHISVANRNFEKAKKICVFKNTHAITFDELEAIKRSYDLIIHASSLGHRGKTLKFQCQHVHDKTIGYDLSYGKAAKPFMEFCDSMSLSHVNDGLGMLVEQAAFAFKRWFDVMPETQKIYQSIQSQLN